MFLLVLLVSYVFIKCRFNPKLNRYELKTIHSINARSGSEVRNV